MDFPILDLIRRRGRSDRYFCSCNETLMTKSPILLQAGNTRLEMTADLREKDQHILKSTSMKQQENPADFSANYHAVHML